MAIILNNLGIEFPDGTTQITAMPIGAVVMWSGSIETIPDTWALCDGSNGTPDLRDKFVIGAGNNYNFQQVGGSADSVVIEHNHGVDGLNSTNSTGTHTHSGNDHTHVVPTATGPDGTHSHGQGPTISSLPTNTHTHQPNYNVGTTPYDHNHVGVLNPSGPHTHGNSGITSSDSNPISHRHGSWDLEVQGPGPIAATTPGPTGSFPGAAGINIVPNTWTHTHPVTYLNAGTHTHPSPNIGFTGSGAHSHSSLAFNSTSSGDHTHPVGVSAVVPNGEHFHPITISSTTLSVSTDPDHSHASQTINASGSPGVNSNLPPFYALAFIMRIE